MSHYTRGELTIKGPECLLRALQELGFTPTHHADPVALEGFQGDKRQERAHVVIPRRQVGAASNDIGFLFQGGRCEVIVSEYDRHRYGPAWLGKVTQLAGVHATLDKARAMGHRAERRVDERGRIQVVVTGGRW